jgi:hypothetical protein
MRVALWQGVYIGKIPAPPPPLEGVILAKAFFGEVGNMDRGIE